MASLTSGPGSDTTAMGGLVFGVVEHDFNTPRGSLGIIFATSRGLSSLFHMDVEMVPARPGAVCMRLILELDRNRNQAPVAYAPLGDDLVGEVLHVAGRTFQHGDLQATVVIQMNVH